MTHSHVGDLLITDVIEGWFEKEDSMDKPFCDNMTILSKITNFSFDYEEFYYR